MKELDKTKNYDLSKLNETERIELFRYNFKYKQNWVGVSEWLFGIPCKDCICFKDTDWIWTNNSEKLTCATELFETKKFIKTITITDKGIKKVLNLNSEKDSFKF